MVARAETLVSRRNLALSVALLLHDSRLASKHVFCDGFRASQSFYVPAIESRSRPCFAPSISCFHCRSSFVTYCTVQLGLTFLSLVFLMPLKQRRPRPERRCRQGGEREQHGVAAGRDEPGGAQRAGRRAAVRWRPGGAAVVDELRGRARCSFASRCGAREWDGD